ncbi:MAG TPA: phosphatase PAP2 family protein [Labilithrix sp.]|jgi:hypothetical protein|nr:phosphatase PAP2 family protein [Labilithrix sp.]
MKDALRSFRAHVGRLWPNCALLPLAPFVLYAAFSATRADLRFEHGASILLVAGLAYTSVQTRSVLVAIYPLGLVGLLYDAMRPLQNAGLTAERVHVCDLRALEARLFGFEHDGTTVTIHDWFRTHHWPAVDLLCAVPYATFILVCFACAAFLAFRDRPAMKRFTWGFLAMNVAGFATYHLLPAAPPWYFHMHGCVVDLSTRASEGPVLMRVDAMLGISYFHTMYSKASSVFGALPSLHCAYPLLVVLEGWRSLGPRLRVLSVAYWLSMVFASVYLDHHWLVDGVLGSAYALVSSLVLRRFLPSEPVEATLPITTITPAEAE